MEKFISKFGEVELTDERENHIFQFHPDVRKYRKHFGGVLSNPEFIRVSKHDPSVFLFYKFMRDKYLVIVIKTNKRNFMLTAYLTGKIQHKSL